MKKLISIVPQWIIIGMIAIGVANGLNYITATAIVLFIIANIYQTNMIGKLCTTVYELGEVVNSLLEK